MNPNEQLARIRVLNSRLTNPTISLNDTGRMRLGHELAEAVIRLDDHLSMGGKLPADWRKK